jgi:hypothetical protein
MHGVCSGENDSRKSVAIQILHQHRPGALRCGLPRESRRAIAFGVLQFAHDHFAGQKMLLRVLCFCPMNRQ